MQFFLSLPLSAQLGIVYVAFINVATFFYFGVDKLKAHWKHRRISERMLWGLALIGGSVGALAGMHFFRHKTKKVSFQVGIAVIIALQLGLLTLFMIQ